MTTRTRVTATVTFEYDTKGTPDEAAADALDDHWLVEAALFDAMPYIENVAATYVVEGRQYHAGHDDEGKWRR